MANLWADLFIIGLFAFLTYGLHAVGREAPDILMVIWFFGVTAGAFYAGRSRGKKLLKGKAEGETTRQQSSESAELRNLAAEQLGQAHVFLKLGEPQGENEIFRIFVAATPSKREEKAHRSIQSATLMTTGVYHDSDSPFYVVNANWFSGVAISLSMLSTELSYKEKYEFLQKAVDYIIKSDRCIVSTWGDADRLEAYAKNIAKAIKQENKQTS